LKFDELTDFGGLGQLASSSSAANVSFGFDGLLFDNSKWKL